MNDLIRREAAINTVFSMLCKWDTEDAEDLKNMLLLAFQELPSAQPEDKCSECDAWNKYKNYRYPQWIPVSDETPAYGEDVLLSIDGKFCAVGHVVQTNDETWYEWYYNGWYHPYEDVKAWMPLPEPWKEEKE